MKRRFFLIIGLLSFIWIGVYAQPRGEGADFEKKYHAQKIAFLTSEMDLSPEEAAVFWPLYNAHEKEMAILKDESKSLRYELSEREDELSEEEAIETLLLFQSNMDKMLETQKEYQSKYLEVISAKKVLIMLRAEKDFRRSLLKELGDKRRYKNSRNKSPID